MQEALGVFYTAALLNSPQNPAKDLECQPTTCSVVCSMNKSDRPLSYITGMFVKFDNS